MTLNAHLSPGFELVLEGKTSNLSDRPLDKLQLFLISYPCTSLQILNKNEGNPQRGDYRSKNKAFSISIFVASAKLQKLVITPK